MGDLVTDSIDKSRSAFVDGNFKDIDLVFDQEKIINKLQVEITDYLVKLSNSSLSDEEHIELNTFFNIINDIERVGDHAENLVELAEERRDEDLAFTDLAIEELNEIFAKASLAFAKAISSFEKNDKGLADEVVILEDQVDLLEEVNRKNHIDRLNKGQCVTESGIVFLDAISNIERMADHSLNIAYFVLDNFK